MYYIATKDTNILHLSIYMKNINYIIVVTLMMVLSIEMFAINKFSDLWMAKSARLLHPSIDMDCPFFSNLAPNQSQKLTILTTHKVVSG